MRVANSGDYIGVTVFGTEVDSASHNSDYLLTSFCNNLA